MTHRDKVMQTIEHRGSGRIPFTVSPGRTALVHGQELLDILCRYPNDFFDPRSLTIPKVEELEKTRKSTDIWGCVWDTEDIMIAGHVSFNPLADWDNFASYIMPEVIRTKQKDIDAAEKTREEYPVWAGLEQFFQIMQNIRGSEQLFMDFYTQPEEVQKLIDRMLNEYHIPQLEELLKLKPDIVGTGDDWGTQTALMINPQLWRQYYKPVYRKLTDICHQGGAKIWFHTCGYTMDILEEFIEIGIDVVNPQMGIMDAKKYGDIARGKITVYPGLNQQSNVFKGSPEDIKNHIHSIYGPIGTASGGLIGYCPIEPDMPLKNIEETMEFIANYSKSEEWGKERRGR